MKYIAYIFYILSFFIFFSLDVNLGEFGLGWQMNIRLPSEPILIILSAVAVCWGMWRIFGAWRLRGGRRQAEPSLRASTGAAARKLLCGGCGIGCGVLHYIVAFYILCMFVSAVFSPLKLVALKSTLRTTLAIVPAFFLFPKVFGARGNVGRASGISNFFALSCISLAALGIYASAKYLISSPYPIRLIGFLPSPFLADHTHWAALTAMFLPISIYFAIYPPNWFKQRLQNQIIFAFASLCLFFALLVSHSRAAIISLLPSIIYFGFSFFKYLSKKHKKLFYGSLAILTVLFIVFFVNLSQITNTQNIGKQDNIFKNIAALANYKQDASSMERVNRWNCAIEIFKERPFLGAGKGAYQFIYKNYQKEEDKTAFSDLSYIGGDAHNEYLCNLSALGIFGFVAYMLIVFLSIYYCLRLIFNLKDKKEKLWIVFLLLSLSSFYIHSLFNNFLWLDSSIFCLFAIISAIYHRYLAFCAEPRA